MACRNQYIAHHLWVGLPGCILIYSTNREVKEFDVWCQLDKVILNDWEPKHWVHRVVRGGHMWVGQKNKICQRKFWLGTISIQQNNFSIPWRIIRQNHWVLLTITRTPRHYWLSLLLLEWPVQYGQPFILQLIHQSPELTFTTNLLQQLRVNWYKVPAVYIHTDRVVRLRHQVLHP